MVYKNVPGVRIEEPSLLAPSVVGVETGIPAFVGHTQKAETAKGEAITEPYPIESLMQYEQLFGKAKPENDLVVEVKRLLDKDDELTGENIITAKFTDTGGPNKFNMYYAVQLFYENGGGRCWIVSTGDTSANSPDPSEIKKGIEKLAKEDEPTMIIIPEATKLPENDYFDVYNKALQQCADLMDRVTILDVLQTDNINDDITKVFRKSNGGLVIDNLRYGAAYYPYLKTTLDYDITNAEGDIKVTLKKIKPDGTEESSEEKTLADLESTENLIYKDCIREINQLPITMPPSPAMAGVYTRVDSERGVWKAPANVGINGIIGTAVKVTDAEQNYMNVDATTGKSVNAIRNLPQGTLVWGARTLDGNSSEWKYISVRRFFNFVEESVKKASARFVFEPNDANTWVKVRAMIENFLNLQWTEGALMGAKPEQAYFVRVGLGQTMTPQDVLDGKMIVEIGMAVVRPAEFITLRFTHKMPEA